MSHFFSIGEICERSLRKIGAFAIRSSGARKEEVDEARYWLDMVVGHQTSRMRTWWMVAGSGTFSLTPGISSYNLQTALGTTQAPNGLQFVIECFLFNTSTMTDIHQLPQRRRQEWEHRELGGPGSQPRDYSPETDGPFAWTNDVSAVTPITPGVPTICYIDRAQSPTMLISPPPDTVQPYGVRVLFQSFPTDQTAGVSNAKMTQIRTAWNLWVVTALAAQIANGPVRKLPADEVADMKKEAMQLRDELESFENMEHANEPRRVFYTDF